MPELIRIKRSTFRRGIILLYAVFLSLIAYTFVPQLLTPKPGEKSLRCEASQLYVGLARAAGQNCKTKCTNWEAADCSGYSSCYNKNVSCNNGIDQDGRPCQGCCYDCVVVCEPDPDKPPSISGSVSCGQWGKNGWCINSAILNLAASDPQGYDLSITGNAKGASISCNGDCSVDLPAGSGVANYVVTASQSGMSASGSASWDFDPTSPNVSLNVSGSTGQNGWYKSPVTVTSTGSDSISGLAGAFLSVDNGTWETSATLGDGKHNIDITAADYAGNIVNSSTTLSIDTKTPSISVSVKGKAGKSKWYASETTASASASDSTSGIASIEVSIDSGPYQPYSSSITFPNGNHTIQFKATDRAGNSTETSKQNILIDLSSPTVSIDASDYLNGTITYKAHDDESGVASIYITIEDKEGKYPKVKWSKSVSGKNVTGEYNWNENFGDEIAVPPGEYSIWIKAVDQAGNDDTQVGNIIVPESDSLVTSSISKTIQEDQSVSSANASDLDKTNDGDNPSNLTYGGETSESTDITNQSLSVSASASSASKNPFPWELILGATTVAAAATTYVVTKSKKTRAQQRETRARLMAELEAKWEAEALAKKASYKASKMKMQSLKTERFDAKDEIEWEKADSARQKALEKVKKEAETKAGLEAYYNARKQGEQEAAASVPPKEKSLWEKAIDFIDKHQTEIAIGVGIVAGVMAIALSGGTATPLVVAGLAALTAGTVTAAGTVGLNTYNNRPWNQNLIRNVGIAATAAGVTTLLPVVMSAGQQVVGAAATNAAMYAYALGVPVLGSVVSFVAPAVGVGWSLWALGSLGAIGYGASIASDPTLSQGERQDGAVIGTMGVQSLDAAVNVYGMADLVNKTSAFNSVGNDNFVNKENARIGTSNSPSVDPIDLQENGSNAGDSLVPSPREKDVLNSLEEAVSPTQVIKRTYQYGDETFEYTFDPSKQAALGNLEDTAPLSTDDFNILRDVPYDIYRNTTIQQDLLDDIVRSGTKPAIFSDPLDPPHRVFQKIEVPYLEQFFGAGWYGI